MEGLFALLIPIIAIAGGLSVGAWSIYMDYKTRQMQYAERKLMIEKGLTPPPVLPDGGKKRVTVEDCLRRGTILLFLGIGLGIGYWALLRLDNGPDPWIAAVGGAIVGLLGVGNLVYYFIARKHNIGEFSPKPTSSSDT
jgi:hypothetical protein